MERSLCVFSILTFVALTLTGCGGGGQPLQGNATSVPMNAISFGGYPRLMVKVKPTSRHGPDATVEELVLVDTGSSTLGFCNKSLNAELANDKTDYFACNQYGNVPPFTGWWGYFYKGEVSIETVDPLPDVYFAVMKDDFDFCVPASGPGGIFGIAFKQLNPGFQGQAPTGWTSKSAGNCPQTEATDLSNPLIQTINNAGGIEHLGIWWSGNFGDGEARLYVDKQATTNEHYVSPSKTAFLGKLGFYDVIITSYAVNGQTFTTSSGLDQTFQDFCGHAGNCILDTGTAQILLPSEVLNAMTSNSGKTLTITFLGANDGGDPVNVDLPIDTLVSRNWVAQADLAEGGSLITGLPIWAFYYILFDLTSSNGEYTVSFSKNPNPPEFASTSDKKNSTVDSNFVV